MKQQYKVNLNIVLIYNSLNLYIIFIENNLLLVTSLKNVHIKYT